MADPWMSLLAAVVTGGLVAAATGPVLRWLPEPGPDEPDADTKVRYAALAGSRFAVGVGAAAGAAALLAWVSLPLTVQPLWAVLASVGVLLAVIDAITTWLPRRLTQAGWLLMLLAGGLTLLLGADLADLVRMVLGALAAGALYLGVWALTRGGLGFGDVRFAPLVGAAAAGHSWTLLLWSLTLGSVVGAGHGLVRLLRRRTGGFPYAPSILAGAYLAALALTTR